MEKVRVFSGVYMGKNGQISLFSAQYGANEPTAGAYGPRGGSFAPCRAHMLDPALQRYVLQDAGS